MHEIAYENMDMEGNMIIKATCKKKEDKKTPKKKDKGKPGRTRPPIRRKR